MFVKRLVLKMSVPFLVLLIIFAVIFLIFFFDDINPIIRKILFSALVILFPAVMIISYVRISYKDRAHQVVNDLIRFEEFIGRFPVTKWVVSIIKWIKEMEFFSDDVIESWCSHNLVCFKNYWDGKKNENRPGLDYSSYTPVAVGIGNEERKFDGSLMTEYLSMFADDRGMRLSIVGDGGNGKTALAIHMAYSMLDRPPTLLPLMIANISINDESTLTEIILAELKKILQDFSGNRSGYDSRVDDDFVLVLIKKSRIVTIIDDIDRVFADWKEDGAPYRKDDWNAHFLYTSRNDVRERRFSKERRQRDGQRDVIRVLPLKQFDAMTVATSHLENKYGKDFSKYANNSGTYKQFTDTIGALSKKGISPLLLTLWMDEFKEQIGKNKRLSFVRMANLLPRYFERMSRYQEESVIDVNVIFTLTKRLAYESIKKNLHPSNIDISIVSNIIEKSIVDNVLDKLVMNFQILNMPETGNAGAVSFRSDVIAEHLAALYVFDEAKESRWEPCKLLIDVYHQLKMYRENTETLGIVKGGFLKILYEYLYDLPPHIVGIDVARFFHEEIGETLFPEGGRPVHIAIVSSLSGTMSIRERSIHDAIMMAIDEVNNQFKRNKNNLQLIVPLPPDTQSKVESALSISRSAIMEHNAVSIFGCWLSNVRRKLNDLVDSYENLLWYTATYEGYQDSSRIIYLGGAPNQQIIPAVEWAVREWGTSVALFGSNYIFSEMAHKIVRRVIDPAIGVGNSTRRDEWSFDLGITTSQDEFYDAISEAVGNGVKWIFHSINGRDTVDFFKALKCFELRESRNVPVMTVSVAESMIRNIGEELLDGCYCCWNYFGSLDGKDNDEFKSSLERTYWKSVTADDPVACAYMSIKIFAEALLRAESITPPSILDAVRKMGKEGHSINGPGGEWHIDADSLHVHKCWYIGKFGRDGAVDVVEACHEPVPPNPRPYPDLDVDKLCVE
uniref:ABC-type branched-chain amino acid transport system, substrate-binding protein n=1 Tax=Candidatus Kentrum sp. LFY TaxID=2126342 RepID=A0A450WDH5_9GAMM|nr:MAG: ABC-type branched-chain amino acid transport system, substrate-binding protein [Candidatus Kentron sp. LFY]